MKSSQLVPPRVAVAALGISTALVGWGVFARAQVPEPTTRPNQHRIEGEIYNPTKEPATDERLARLTMPDGFRVERFAEDLKNPRMIAVDRDGTVYVTRREVGDVLMLRDTNGDGRADVQQVVAERPQMHGIAIDRDGRRMYLTTVKEVFAASIQPDGKLSELEMLIDDLPDGGQHPNRTMQVGPDGRLYITVGSTCNACDETNPEHATMLRATPDGQQRTIFARGLRNTLGFAWHPRTGQLWGMDHGIDWLGNDGNREELNLIEEGKHYGWPYVYEDGKPTPHRAPPDGITHEQWAQMTEGPKATYTAHAAPMQLTFYTGNKFPSRYRNSAFIAMRGSWNRNPPVGYEIVEIRFDDRGQPMGIEPFVSGFLQEEAEGRFAHIGRLAGLAEMPDGSLIFCDDTNGNMYRIVYGD